MQSFVCNSLIWLLAASRVQGGPLPVLGRRKDIEGRIEDVAALADVSASNRTIFMMISLVCVGLLSFLLGSRFSRLKRYIFVKRNFISILVLIIYTLVLVFIIVSTVLVAGQGLNTYGLCIASTWVCLILYTLTKFATFLFLVERIHIVRAPFVERKRDKIYLACLATLMVTYGPVIINWYINPVTTMGSSGRRCNFGIKGNASIPVLAANIFMDLVLTSVFFYLLRPVVKFRGLQTIIHAFQSQPNGNTPLEANESHDTPVQRNIQTLMWKSIIGSLLIEIPMMANMIQFVITKGEELGMVCMVLCIVEVCDALVIHWLAFGPSAQAARDLERSGRSSKNPPFTAPHAQEPSVGTGGC